MNTLHEQIKSSIKAAMLARDTVRLSTIRGLVTAFTNELVARGKKPTDFLEDTDTLLVISRTAKQRRDAIVQFRAASRNDLADEDAAQLAILEEFLPQLMTLPEVQSVANAKKAELGIFEAKDKGRLMAELMKELKGKADGGVVKEVVDSFF